MIRVIALFLFKLARSRLGATFVRWAFTHATRVMPVEHRQETDLVVSFSHPKPTHEVHFVVVPKTPVRTMMDLSTAHEPVLREIFSELQRLARELRLEENGYSVIVNGGARQEVPQLHFHLISGRKIGEANDSDLSGGGVG